MPDVDVRCSLWQPIPSPGWPTGAGQGLWMSGQPDNRGGGSRGGEPGIECYWPSLPACAFSASSRSHADPGRVTFHESRAFPWVLAHRAQVHSCALLFLRQRWPGAGWGVWPGRREAWLSPSAGTNSLCALACHSTSLRLSFLTDIIKGRTARPKVPSS